MTYILSKSHVYTLCLELFTSDSIFDNLCLVTNGNKNTNRNSGFPLGIPVREKRPRSKPDIAKSAFKGAVLGGLATRHPDGALVGAGVGAILAKGAPYPLDESLRMLLWGTSLHYVKLTRHGPFKAVLVVGHNQSFFRLESQAPLAVGWTQEGLDDWLYGDLKKKIAEWMSRDQSR